MSASPSSGSDEQRQRRKRRLGELLVKSCRLYIHLDRLRSAEDGDQPVELGNKLIFKVLKYSGMKID
jgi:hypothetical protein